MNTSNDMLTCNTQYRALTERSARCVIYAHSWNDDGEHTRLFLSRLVVSKYLINTQWATHLASRIEWVELCVACWVARDRFWNGFFFAVKLKLMLLLKKEIGVFDFNWLHWTAMMMEKRIEISKYHQSSSSSATKKLTSFYVDSPTSNTSTRERERACTVTLASANNDKLRNAQLQTAI